MVHLHFDWCDGISRRIVGLGQEESAPEVWLWMNVECMQSVTVFIKAHPGVTVLRRGIRLTPAHVRHFDGCLSFYPDKSVSVLGNLLNTKYR